MKRRRLVYGPEALDDLKGIYDWIANEGSPLSAKRYVARIRRFAATLKTSGDRGNDHGAIQPGLRSVGFERSIQIVCELRPEAVIVTRVFHGGQDWTTLLGRHSED